MFNITEEMIHDYKILKVTGENQGDKAIEVWINPADGMTLCKIIVGKHTVVDWHLERCRAGATYGVPVLYPTPNRVANGAFTFEGQRYPMSMHGMANHMAFELQESCVTEDEVQVVGTLEFSEGTEAYAKFPFKSVLTMSVTITYDSVKVSYTVENKEDKALPYGIALHPFFMKLGKSLCKTSAKSLMEMTEEKLPTGELIDIKGTLYDLSEYIDVESVQLDHVYTGIEEVPQAEILYPKIGLKVELESSKEFTHLVVFTPANQNFFCIENQSCSTNAHNMYAKGFEEVSGLEIVQPHTSKKGYIDYKFKYL